MFGLLAAIVVFLFLCVGGQVYMMNTGFRFSHIGPVLGVIAQFGYIIGVLACCFTVFRVIRGPESNDKDPGNYHDH